MFAFVISSAILVSAVPALFSLQDCQHPSAQYHFLKSLFLHSAVASDICLSGKLNASYVKSDPVDKHIQESAS